jgi:hypothetical protein
MTESREERKARLTEEAKAQREIDLAAINDIEIELGDSNVAVLDYPYTPGLSVCAAVRVLTDIETKRYRARVKGEDADATAAAEEVGRACVMYPKGDALAALAKSRPGLWVQLGLASLRMAAGRAEAEGKG